MKPSPAASPAPAEPPPAAARAALAPSPVRGAEPLIRIAGVTRRFGEVAAVDDLSLDIHEGEFFCLLGPSGCGKSTLLRLLAGFETPDEGRIWLAGQDLTGVPPHRRPVNMMFQSYALFPHLTIAGNVAFGLKQEGLPRAEIAERVADMLRLVQLDGLERRYPAQVSGGQRQRVALARALAKRPKVLLLDEPLAALDRKLREETQHELRALQARLGTTFVVVTHDQDEAMHMAGRIAVMQRGQIAQLGTPRQVYEEPASRFIASFIGDVNLLEGQVEGRAAGRCRVRLEGVPDPILVAEPDGAPATGERVAVAIRPETMALRRPGAAGGDPDENLLLGRIAQIGYLGDLTSYRVSLAGGALLRVTQGNVRRRAGEALEVGAAVEIAIPPDAAILLTR